MANVSCPSTQSVDNDLKKYRQRDLSQTLLFKVACRTFGPPKSRRRRIIAPPMEKGDAGADDIKMAPHGPPNNCNKEDTNQEILEALERDAQKERANWILERKKLRAQLDSMGDVKMWLRGKPQLTELETRVWDRMVEETPQSQMSNVTSLDTEVDRSCPVSPPPRRVTPKIRRPCPEALGVLDHYLHQCRLRLVDLYNQTDKSKNRKISSQDFKAVRKEARIPVTDLQFDDLVISLSKKNPNYINYKELSRARGSWRRENKEDRNKQPATKSVGLSQYQEYQNGPHDDVRPSTVLSGSLVALEGTRTNYSEGSRSQLLQVPPVNLEERRPLTYEDMEEIGKMYRERRRQGMSNTRLLDWLEKCRLVRTGNAAVDSHSLPSTLEDGTAETVEQYRRQYLQQYYKILQLCQSSEVPISEKQLERALLYPGDKLTHSAGQWLKFRQPGTSPIKREHLPQGSRKAGRRDIHSRDTVSESARTSRMLSRELSAPVSHFDPTEENPHNQLRSSRAPKRTDETYQPVRR
ncbi:EF-hand calcium-binding domain-containing protein 12 [Discoglossus pictus]